MAMAVRCDRRVFLKMSTAAVTTEINGISCIEELATLFMKLMKMIGRPRNRCLDPGKAGSPEGSSNSSFHHHY
jgi:hypothetical protein